jgi:hypothetical protein
VAEITLNEIASLGQTSFGDDLVTSLDLIVVVIETGDVSTSVLGNVSEWSTDTTTHIKDLFTFFEEKAVSQPHFVTQNSTFEGVEALGGRKMKGSVILEAHTTKTYDPQAHS